MAEMLKKFPLGLQIPTEFTPGLEKLQTTNFCEQMGLQIQKFVPNTNFAPISFRNSENQDS